MDRIRQFFNLSLSFHLIIGALIRSILIVYADYHDKVHDVPYTDVDYKVFTDAARHVVLGESPYKRHTYRYSPLLAFLLVPNILLHRNFGKILFSLFDIFVAVAVKVLVEHQLRFRTKNNDTIRRIAVYSSLIWLYNPMSVAISTRGNADSVPCFFIILSILFLQTDIVKGYLKCVISGFLLGFSIHLRLYPIAFSFPMYLSLGDFKINRRTKIKDGLLLLLPNVSQIILAFSCILSLLTLTYGMYLLYGYEFLFETYIYHLFRKDSRHNFSVLFYYSYLTMDQLTFDIVKTMSLIFECIILFMLSLTFGCDKKTLPFALFAQSIVLVAYNSVMTSQYFIWFLSLLPLVAHDFDMKPSKALCLTTIWTLGQALWLFYAYLLEFRSCQVFIMIWLSGLGFFSANIYVLSEFIRKYSPGHAFGQISRVIEKIN